MSELQASAKTAGGTIPSFRVLINSSGAVVVATAATDQPIGASQDTSAVNGELIPCYFLNQRLKLQAGAAIAAGMKVMAAANGKIVTYVSAAGNFPIGITLEAATADGNVIDVMVNADLNPQVVDTDT